MFLTRDRCGILRAVRVLLVIPALNEEAVIGSVVEELKQAIESGAITGEILVIDDGSKDRTAEIAHKAGARVARMSRNLGIGGAVQCGIRVALREGFDGAIQVDGDGQHPPSEIAKLLEVGAREPASDLVIGTRYLSSDGFRSTFLRRLGGWWLSRLLRVVAGASVSDPTSGFRLYGKRALELFDRNYPYDYPEPEAVAIAMAAGLRVTETPVVMRDRQAGRSSIIGYRTIYYMLKVTLAVMLAYVRNRKR